MGKLKRKLYFSIASYFRFFANLHLQRWKPKIIVITGSNGKTTLLHLIESQIGERAKYSHHANSSFGIPFDILDLHRKTLQPSEWLSLFIKAPFAVFKKLPQEKLYVVEADCDRPGEGKFLAEFLRPHIVLWVSSAKTHSMNFDPLVKTPVIPSEVEESSQQRLVKRSTPRSLPISWWRLHYGRDDKKVFSSVEAAIAFEYGYFLEYCQEFAVIDGDNLLMTEQISRTKVQVKIVQKAEHLENYELTKSGTKFVIEKQVYTLPFLLPEEVFYSISLAEALLTHLQIKSDHSFKNFSLPPGRSSLFRGVKDTTLIDSCYNATPDSMQAIIHMYELFPGKKKWAVIGDMIELGESEQAEHEKLAELLEKADFDKIILMGARVSKYTLPKLKVFRDDIVSFSGPKELLDYLLQNIAGGETILFKGARFMEGVIEHLLADKKDAAKLARREKVWEIRRKQWGL